VSVQREWMREKSVVLYLLRRAKSVSAGERGEEEGEGEGTYRGTLPVDNPNARYLPSPEKVAAVA
jgi:hypothetical protein